MLAVARALLARPRLLLIDEPSLGLAPLTAQELFGRLKQLRDDWSLTIVLAEQNARLSLAIADQSRSACAGTNHSRRACGRSRDRGCRQAQLSRRRPRNGPPVLRRRRRREGAMTEFLQIVLDGFMTGTVYAALALALSVVFQGTGMLNLAQGELAVVAAYVAWMVVGWGLDIWIAIPIAVVASALLGAATYQGIVRFVPAHREDSLMTIGVTLLLGLERPGRDPVGQRSAPVPEPVRRLGARLRWSAAHRAATRWCAAGDARDGHHGRRLHPHQHRAAAARRRSEPPIGGTARNAVQYLALRRLGGRVRRRRGGGSRGRSDPRSLAGDDDHSAAHGARSDQPGWNHQPGRRRDRRPPDRGPHRHRRSLRSRPRRRPERRSRVLRGHRRRPRQARPASSDARAWCAHDSADPGTPAVPPPERCGASRSGRRIRRAVPRERLRPLQSVSGHGDRDVRRQPQPRHGVLRPGQSRARRDLRRRRLRDHDVDQVPRLSGGRWPPGRCPRMRRPGRRHRSPRHPPRRLQPRAVHDRHRRAVPDRALPVLRFHGRASPASRSPSLPSPVPSPPSPTSNGCTSSFSSCSSPSVPPAPDRVGSHRTGARRDAREPDPRRLERGTGRSHQVPVLRHQRRDRGARRRAVRACPRARGPRVLSADPLHLASGRIGRRRQSLVDRSSHRRGGGRLPADVHQRPRPRAGVGLSRTARVRRHPRALRHSRAERHRRRRACAHPGRDVTAACSPPPAPAPKIPLNREELT